MKTFNDIRAYITKQKVRFLYYGFTSKRITYSRRNEFL